MSASSSGDLASFEADAVRFYLESCKIPSIASGHLFAAPDAANVIVESSWKQRNVCVGEMSHYDRLHFVKIDEKGVASVNEAPFPQKQTKNIELKRSSPSSKYRAVVVSSDDKKKQFLEIWSKEHLFCSFDVTSSKEHGKIVCDEPFCCMEWSKREDKILFVAEKYVPKSASFFEPKTAEDNAGEAGKQYLYRESWGEQLPVYHPLPVLFDMETKTTKCIDGIPERLSVGQAAWDSNYEGIFFIGWEHFPRRLGLRFCDNRKSAVYYLKFSDSSLELLSYPNRSVAHMRLNTSSNTLVFFDQPEGGPHKSCQRLIAMDLETKTKTIIIDTVEKTIGADDFPGLFVYSVAARLWLRGGDSQELVFATQWRSNREVVSVNVKTKQLRKMSPPELAGSWVVLDVQDNLVLCTYSSFSSPFQLFLLRFKGDDVVPIELTQPPLLFEDKFTWQCISFLPTSEPFKDISFEGLLLEPVSQPDKLPLIALCHGGPHGICPTDYSATLASFCLLGFSVLVVNYRGSVGFGKASIDSLVGNVGTVEVGDVHQAVCQVVANGKVDPSRVFVTGGSHGGFLTAHLVGQYPSYYRAACLQNPVINFVSMLGVTDIPDWTYAEAGLSYSFELTSSPATLKTMTDVSPIRFVDRVTAPCLLSLGGKDLRVPKSQGLEFYYALKARGIPTELYFYPDSTHGLVEVDVDSDRFVATVAWFFKHAKKPT